VVAGVGGGVLVVSIIAGALVAGKRGRLGPAEDDDPSPVAPQAPGLRHVTPLDGIRGVAVLAVVAFHTGQPWARGGFLGVAVGYVANWRFIFAKAGYFDAFAVPSPLRHMWSLAVEEQFYVVWPVTALVLLRRFRTPRALLAVAALGSVASIIAMSMLFHPGRDPSRAYY